MATPEVCYEATLSAGLVGILPGFIILAGSLELAGKNFVGGAVRLGEHDLRALAVTASDASAFRLQSTPSSTRFSWAVSLSHQLLPHPRSADGTFCAVGIGVGSDLYGLMDRRHLGDDNTDNTVNIMGTVYNGTVPFLTGRWVVRVSCSRACHADTTQIRSFSFDNGTLSDSLTAINSGNIKCNRAPTDGWYARPLSNDWYLFLLVPAFAVLLALSNLQPLKRPELLAMVCIGCAGWVTNHFAGQYIAHRVSRIGCLDPRNAGADHGYR